MIPLRYNVRNLVVRKTTTVASVLGIALVVFVFASVLMLSHGIKKTLGRAGSTDVAMVMRKGSDTEMSSGIEDSQVGLVLASKEVARGPTGAPQGVGEMVVVIALEKVGVTGGLSNVMIRGVPDSVLAFRPSVRIVEGRPARPGSDEVIIGERLRGRFRGVDLGESFLLRKNRPVRVVGVFADGGSSFESEVWGDLETVRTAFRREGIVSSIRARLVSASQFDVFKLGIEQNRQLGLEVMQETAYYAKQSEGTSLFITALGLVIAIFFSLGAMIGAMITMYAQIAHRQREIGTLRALGFSRRSILLSFLIESMLLGVAGGGLGAVASMAMGFVRFSTMNFASWSEISFSFEPKASIVASAMIAACGMGLLGGFLPAIRAARVSPVQAMRE